MTYAKFLNRFEEVLDLPPQRIGFLTPVYKSIVKNLKVMPWPWFLLLSLIFVVGAYTITGSAITLLVTMLQRSL